MLLIIHNLPPNTRYTDVKALIKEKCGLTEMIVDNLVPEGKNKKVTVGLADEGDAAILVRKINGLYVCNQQLYVENVRQKKTNEQPYQPGPMSKQFDQGQNQFPPSLCENQFNRQHNEMQFQSLPLMPMDSQSSPRPPPPNFGMPFYMSAQNQNVGNNRQYMVQYPIAQGSVGSEPCQGRDMEFDQQYGGRKRDRSMSPDRSPYREPSPKRYSRRNESDCDRSDSRRDQDRPAQRDDRRNTDQSHKDRPYRDSFENRPKQDYSNKSSSSNRFQKPSNRSETHWDRPDRSIHHEQNEPYRSNDKKKFNPQGHSYNQEKESQRFRENNYSHSRGSDSQSRPSDLSKKRPYVSSEKNVFYPPNKKIVSTPQRYGNQPGPSGSAITKNYQNKKFAYSNKNLANAPIRQNRPYVPTKVQQKPKAPFKFNDGKEENTKPTNDMLAKHMQWRAQATAAICTEILKSLGKLCPKKDTKFLCLKSCVRARIDVVVDDNISLTMKDIIDRYREEFQDDEALYNTVCEKIATGEMGEFGTATKVTERVAVGPTINTATLPKHQFIGKLPVKAPGSATTDRLPKYPDGNKQLLKQLKDAQKEEMLNDSLYQLDDVYEKVLNEELDKIDKLIRQQCKNPQSDAEKSVSKFMNEDFVPDVLKVLGRHVRKRILDIRTGLSLRVIFQYKPPKRELLDAYLKDFGVICLKASDKNNRTMVALCDSFENYDALCKQESTVIDNLKVSFKPLHITGPPLRGKFKRQFENINKITTNDSSKQCGIDVTITNKKGNVKKEPDGGIEGMKTDIKEAKTSTDVQGDQPVQDNQLVHNKLPVKEDKPVKEDQPIKDNQPVQNNQSVQGNQPVQDNQPVQNNQSVQGNQPVQDNQPVQNNQSVQGNHPVKEDQPIKDNQPVQNSQLVKGNQPVQNNQSVQENQPIEVTENNECLNNVSMLSDCILIDLNNSKDVIVIDESDNTIIADDKELSVSKALETGAETQAVTNDIESTAIKDLTTIDNSAVGTETTVQDVPGLIDNDDIADDDLEDF